jgi:hypothetical protein
MAEPIADLYRPLQASAALVPELVTGGIESENRAI